MIDLQNIAFDVRQFVIDNFLFGDEETFANDTSFEQDGIVDSTGILELIMFLEETYGISIEDRDLKPENLDSIQNIERFVKGKLTVAA